MGMNSFLVGLAPFAALASLECLEVGLNTQQSSHVKGDETTRPPINFSVLCKIFLLSFVGIIVMQNCM
ncbi:hypothetical protein SLEP1_g55545 [Rubroshorea leprosula]|uniref:Uncharacterized protein n=1 Tax=Rubroshorea leprosula TaxID=152421 RepID=A0AAV5MGU0_9ROSI|nr:hypothetical protein SLEP1_g55545 [Rubroshorea leprosula]